MSNTHPKTKQKKAPTPRQLEIKRLTDKGREARNDQESAKLDQLKKEERRERFLRLAVKRRNNTLKQMRNVERMANKSVYDYSQEEAQRIVETLSAGMEAIKLAFAGKKAAELSNTL